MSIGIVYYSDNRLDGTIIGEMSKKTILESNLPIVSCTLKPIDFGQNIVLEGRVRSHPTQTEQILIALETSTSEYVFFCEHDVLYHISHFDYIPPTDNYYYNINNWRQIYPEDLAHTYDELTATSGLCCNRERAIKHYKYRLELYEEWGLDKIRSREPRWARRFGYEPGTKKKKTGGITNEDHAIRRSEFPNIDIRHAKTFTRPPIRLEQFGRPPTNWQEITLDKIPGWNLKELFNL